MTRSHARSRTTLLVAACALALAGTGFAIVPAAEPDASLIVQSSGVEQAASAVERAGGKVVRALPIVDGVHAKVPARSVATLQRIAGMRVSPNQRITVRPPERAVTDQGTTALPSAEGTQTQPSRESATGSTPSPTHAASAVYAKVVRADKLWSARINGSGITVGVIDTGIAKVADLKGRVVGGVDFTIENDPYKDSFGHGTFVAGLIAGNGSSSKGAYKGIAPSAKLVSIKIADASGASDVSHVLAAVQWAVSFKDTYGIRVLNLSLGTDSSQSYRISPLNYAVERAWDSGIVVVVSSSNEGPGAGTVSKPGDDPLVITLGAIDDRATVTRSDDVMAGFSGQGPTRADGLTKPDLVAPGRSVISLRAPGSAVDKAYPGSRIGTAYFRGSGTSFSSAIASGAAALILHKNSKLTPDQVKYRMMSTAPAGPVGNPNVDGDGSLDVYAAATATTTAAANKGVVRSDGSGSLEADRGTLGVVIHTTTSIVGGPLGTLLNLLGWLTAQNKNFDAQQFLTSDWSGSRWYDSQWAGSRWYQTDWSGSRWYGSRWYTTEWYGSRWYAIAWE